jgi:chromosome segregation ATPase
MIDVRTQGLRRSLQEGITTLFRVMIAAGAVVLAGLCMAEASPVASGPRVGETTGAGVQETSPAGLSGFVRDIGKRVRACHERMAHVGEPLAETIRGMQPADIDPESLASGVEAAKAAFKSATLAREGFEIELKGYLDATFPEEQARYEKELEQANDDLAQAKKMQTVADERLEKIKKLFEKSAAGVDIEYRFEVGRLIAELDEKRAGFSIEQAKSKLKVLREYEKDKRTKDLKSEIERASSNELAAKAQLTLTEAQLRRSRRPGRELSESEKKLLGLLEQALAVDERVRGKLEELRKNGKTDAGLQKEITKLTNQLEAAVDRAEAEDARARFEALKSGRGRTPARRPRS